VLTKSRQRLTKSSKGRADLVIGWSRTDGDTRQDHGGGIADTLLQLGLAVWASKPLVDGFAVFGLENPEWSLVRHVASSRRFCRGEAFS